MKINCFQENKNNILSKKTEKSHLCKFSINKKQSISFKVTQPSFGNIKILPTVCYLDLQKKEPKAIQILGDSLKTYGVCLIKHNIPSALLNSTLEHSSSLFKLPNAYLATISDNPLQKLPRGFYSYKGEPVLKTTSDNPFTPNPKQAWQIGEAGNTFPHGFQSMQTDSEELYSHIRNIGDSVIQALEHYLDDKQKILSHICLISKSNPYHLMQLMHYPAFPKSELSKYPENTKFVRHYEHTDGSLFSLCLATSQAGMEYKMPNGDWLRLPTQPNTLIIHTGEILELITKDSSKNIIRASHHRVVGNALEFSKPRYTINFFYSPNKDASLRSIKTNQLIKVFKINNNKAIYYTQQGNILQRLYFLLYQSMFSLLPTPSMMSPLQNVGEIKRMNRIHTFVLDNLKKYYYLRNRININQTLMRDYLTRRTESY